MRNAAIIVAAGRGLRARTGPGTPKQYAAIGGEAVLTRTIRSFARHRGIGAVLVVIHPGDQGLYDQAVAALAGDLRKKLRPSVPGGASRQRSVHAGLAALKVLRPDNVLIHDAARPFVAAPIIDRVIDALAGHAVAGHAGAIAALPVADTLKRAADDLTIAGTVDRQGLWRAQTPQAFRFAKIFKAHQDAAAAGLDSFTDDAALAEWAGLTVMLVEGSAANIKLTTAEDLAMAARSSASNEAATAAMPDIRSGTGFDVHRFCDGDHVWLCGVRIPFDKSLDGHSDADVGLHALTDALLGAIGEGDIGAHFPPTDPQWRGASSDLFLADAVQRLAERNGQINNVDVTLICERPKLAPHRQAMREAIAAILGICASRVSVKATTTEGLGFTGRGEGIAAMAAVSVALAPSG